MEEVKNCMVSVKVDGVTRLDCSFLGINIQYCKNSQIVLRTLALKEIMNQHMGDNLKRMIMDVFSSCQIGPDQMYSITTDNSTNLLKAVKIITSENGDYDVIENKSDTDSSDENGEIIKIIVQNDENDDPNHGMEENAGIQGVLEFGNDEFFQIFKYDFNNDGSSTSATMSSLGLKMTGMRCAAHMLQLAIEEALKQDKRVGKLILGVRTIVKTLRTQTFMYTLRKQKLKELIIDCLTRWGSSFDMLKRLLQLKEFCTEMKFTNFNKFRNLSESDWNRIVEVVSALEPARKCTCKF